MSDSDLRRVSCPLCRHFTRFQSDDIPSELSPDRTMMGFLEMVTETEETDAPGPSSAPISARSDLTGPPTHSANATTATVFESRFSSQPIIVHDIGDETSMEEETAMMAPRSSTTNASPFPHNSWMDPIPAGDQRSMQTRSTDAGQARDGFLSTTAASRPLARADRALLRAQRAEIRRYMGRFSRMERFDHRKKKRKMDRSRKTKGSKSHHSKKGKLVFFLMRLPFILSIFSFLKVPKHEEFTMASSSDSSSETSASYSSSSSSDEELDNWDVAGPSSSQPRQTKEKKSGKKVDTSSSSSSSSDGDHGNRETWDVAGPYRSQQRQKKKKKSGKKVETPSSSSSSSDGELGNWESWDVAGPSRSQQRKCKKKKSGKKETKGEERKKQPRKASVREFIFFSNCFFFFFRSLVVLFFISAQNRRSDGIPTKNCPRPSPNSVPSTSVMDEVNRRMAPYRVGTGNLRGGPGSGPWPVRPQREKKGKAIMKDLFCCPNAGIFQVPATSDWEALRSAGLGLKRNVPFPSGASSTEVDEIIKE